MNNFRIAYSSGYTKDMVKLPLRGTNGSAGLDFFCPENTSFFKAEMFKANNNHNFCSETGIEINPGKRVLIPSGIKVKIPEGTAFISFEKSGLATKKGIVPTCRVVDSDYQGEIYIGLLNTSDTKVVMEYGSKIGQYILVYIDMEKYEVVPEKELYETESSRGAGGFGSTGDK